MGSQSEIKPISRRWLTSIPERIKSKGIIGFTSQAFKFALGKAGFAWRRGIIAECFLEEIAQEIKPSINVSIRLATKDDLIKFRGMVSRNKLETFKKRFEKGRVCFIALDKDKIAYYRWASLENEYESNFDFTIQLNRNEAYIFDAFSQPQYRRCGLHIAITNKALIYIKSQGYKRVQVVVYANNTFARKTLAKVGFQGKQTVTLVTLFGLKYHLWREFKGNL